MSRARINLPLTNFLYTLDQVALILSVDDATLRNHYIYFEGRSAGLRTGKMTARNIAPATAPPDWRVAEVHLRNYLSLKGYQVVEPKILGK